MTTREKIQVLEKAIPLIRTYAPYGDSGILGICRSIAHVRMISGFEVNELLASCDISLPKEEFGVLHNYCWPLTPEGDEERRAFLRSHIDRLKKELETEKP